MWLRTSKVIYLWFSKLNRQNENINNIDSTALLELPVNIIAVLSLGTGYSALWDR